MSWAFLTAAILTEVAATLSLKIASAGRTRWYTVVVVGYATAFSFLTLALDAGMALGFAYGVWTASGVALIAILSQPLFGERVSRTTWFGIGLIVLGVLAIELGSSR